MDLGRNACLHVRRVKNGMPGVHPLQGDEMRALRELKRSADSPFVFVSERGAPFTRAGFAKMIARLGVEAGVQVRRASAHAAPCMRLRACQQGAWDQSAAGLSRPQEHSAHGAIYGTVANAFQRLLESLARR